MELLGELSAEYGYVDCLADQTLADMFGLETGVSPVGWFSFFFIMTTVQPETSSYSLSYFAPIVHLDPKYLCFPILAFHLNCTKGTYNSKLSTTKYDQLCILDSLLTVFNQQVYWYLLVRKRLMSEYYCNYTC